MQVLPTSFTRGASRTAISLCLFALGAQASFAQSLVPAPDWVQSIAPGTWQAVSLNKIADVDPAKDPDVNPNYPNSPPWNGATGQRAVIGAWGGGAYATKQGNKGTYLIFGGGHNDYYGSEVYGVDMETRIRTRGPSTGRTPPQNIPTARQSRRTLTIFLNTIRARIPLSC